MLERRVMITEKKTLGSEGTFERLEIVEQRLNRGGRYRAKAS